MLNLILRTPVSEIPALSTKKGGLRPGIAMPMIAAGVSVSGGPGAYCPWKKITIGGDFNLVSDVEKDKSGGLARTHQKALKVIQDFSENLALTNIWRFFNPKARRYTWRQNQLAIRYRLEFFASK